MLFIYDQNWCGDILWSRVPVLGSPIPPESLNRLPLITTPTNGFSTANELTTNELLTTNDLTTTNEFSTTSTRIPFHLLPLCSAQLPGPCRSRLFILFSSDLCFNSNIIDNVQTNDRASDQRHSWYQRGNNGTK